ncbi:hypothetical protein ACFS7Z_22210 [Pontibacter toksunensis]|uniref:Uncharacterized protein n=1 Tax=Pontibacter toksunensis TaxID=1332631 RepID=A0ABW6C4L3_9BACT
MITNLLLNPEPSRMDDSCLFMSKYKLQRAHCPFEVVCIKEIRKITVGEKLRVDKVLSWHSGVVLFFIKGKLYPHSHFSYRPPTQFVATGIK